MNSDHRNVYKHVYVGMYRIKIYIHASGNAVIYQRSSTSNLEPSDNSNFLLRWDRDTEVKTVINAAKAEVKFNATFQYS